MCFDFDILSVLYIIFFVPDICQEIHEYNNINWTRSYHTILMLMLNKTLFISFCSPIFYFLLITIESCKRIQQKHGQKSNKLQPRIAIFFSIFSFVAVAISFSVTGYSRWFADYILNERI